MLVEGDCRQTSIRRFARRLVRLRFRLRFFGQQPMQFGARLHHQSLGELACRALALIREIFYPHVQQRDIGFDAAQSLLKALSQLDSGLAQPLVLQEVNDLSVTEIAGIMDLNEGTVKSRLFSARKRLRQLLGEPL